MSKEIFYDDDVNVMNLNVFLLVNVNYCVLFVYYCEYLLKVKACHQNEIL